MLSVFYVVVAVAAYSWLAVNGRLAQWVPLGDFFLMAFAIFRLVRLFTYDSITQFIRDWFHGKSTTSFLGTLGTLVNCPWCTGLWFALVVVFGYFATPAAWYLILVLALASIASFFQLLSNLIGWSAEAKKKEARSL